MAKSKKGSTKKDVGSKKIPEGIMVLAGLSILGAFVTFIISSYLFSIADSTEALTELMSIGMPGYALFYVGIGILLLGITALNFFIGRGLLKGQRWTRIILLVFVAVGIIGAISNLVGGMIYSGIFALIIDGLILWYFFRKKVINFFK